MKILSKHRTAKETRTQSHDSQLLPQESPIVPAIINVSISIQIEGRINTLMIKDYFSLIILAFLHDILNNKPGLKAAIAPLWAGITDILGNNATVHQVSELITEMIATSAKFAAFTEGASIDCKSPPFHTQGTRTWEFQGSENSVLVTILTYSIYIKPGAHHMRDSLRSTGHIMLSQPTPAQNKTIKDLHKWLSTKNKTHPQIVEHLLVHLLDQKIESLSTTIQSHTETNSSLSSQDEQSAVTLYYPN